MKILKFKDIDMSPHDIRSRIFFWLKDFGENCSHITVSL